MIKIIFITLLLMFTSNTLLADEFSDLLDDIGNEVGGGVGVGFHSSRNDYITDNFNNTYFYQISGSAFLGSRIMQLRALAFAHYSNGYDKVGSYIVSNDFDFWELNGNLGFAIQPFETIFLPGFSLMGSFNYYYMDGENRVDPGLYTSLVWNFPTSKGFDIGIEPYNNFVFDKLNSEEKDTFDNDIDYGNSGDIGIRVYINFIGEIAKTKNETTYDYEHVDSDIDQN